MGTYKAVAVNAVLLCIAIAVACYFGFMTTKDDAFLMSCCSCALFGILLMFSSAAWVCSKKKGKPVNKFLLFAVVDTIAILGFEGYGLWDMYAHYNSFFGKLNGVVLLIMLVPLGSALLVIDGVAYCVYLYRKKWGKSKK